MKKYNEDIMEAVRQHIGLNEDDESADEKIMSMDKSDVFSAYCKWNGLMGSWYETLLEVIEDIYNVELLN